MAIHNFWTTMNKGLKDYNSSNKPSTSPKEKRAQEINNHQYKDSVGGDASNYKGGS